MSAMGWFVAAAIMVLTIFGIPWAKSAVRIAVLTLWPFGTKIGNQRSLGPIASTFSLLGNLVWVICAGWWLAVLHLGWALLLAVTVIGIPFAVQHFKLAKLCLFPLGKDLVL